MTTRETNEHGGSLIAADWCTEAPAGGEPVAVFTGVFIVLSDIAATSPVNLVFISHLENLRATTRAASVVVPPPGVLDPPLASHEHSGIIRLLLSPVYRVKPDRPDNTR